MKGSLALQRTSTLSSAQQGVKAGLREMGIGIDDRLWVWPAQFGEGVRIDWASFIAPFSSIEDHLLLGETLRWLMACWLTGCGGQFVPVAPATAKQRIQIVRKFLLALVAKDGSLDATTPRQAQQVIQRFYFSSSGECTATDRTLRAMFRLAHDLYRLRAYLPTGFSVDPFPPGFVRKMHAHGKRSDPWVAPPEPVCLELIRQAIRLLGTPADDLIRLRRKYILASESAKRRRLRRDVVGAIAARSLHGERFATLPGEDHAWTALSAEYPLTIKHLIGGLEGACALVLLFLSGPRMSEIRQARPGCLRYLRHSNGIEYPYYFAHRSKQMASSKEGIRSRIGPKSRGWILGPAGVRALEVLEQLSCNVRRLSGVDSFWATIRSRGLWTCTERTTVSVISSDRLNLRLNVFASMIGLADRTGWRGRLHSHMGRKACARFIAKRDRTALADLALQFGHLSAYVTDSTYARPDAEYQRLIDQELAAEMRETAVELAGLDLQSTFSNMGSTRVAALRDRLANFVGELYSTADVRRLLGQGVRLVPCDWGMCVYREETSACGGNQFGPSAERRSPVVCRTCINFVATEKHRPYWRRRIEDCQRVLALRDIPEQVRRLVQLRMAEAKEVLSSISREAT
jgi:hypothetical protein